MKILRSFAIALLITAILPAESAVADGTHDAPRTTAMQAAEAGTEEAMRNFVLHAGGHVEEAFTGGADKIAELFRAMRQEGEWKNGSTYLIHLTSRGAIYNHGRHIRSLFGDSLGDLPTVKSLIEELQKPDRNTACVRYGEEGSMKWACATSYEFTFKAEAQTYKWTNFVIGGFDHEENNPKIGRFQCPEEWTPSVTAAQLNQNPSRADLQKFVGEALNLVKTVSEKSGVRETFRVLYCFHKPGPWKSGSVYLFLMTGKTTVFVNGLNPELAGTNFQNVFDEDGVDISAEILKAAATEGKGGFVSYKWDDPAVDGDEVFGIGKAPGTSPKITYVQSDLFPALLNQTLIVGSGYYPMMEVDTGCAVAGEGGNLSGRAFGIFLAVFSVCFVLCARSRKRDG